MTIRIAQVRMELDDAHMELRALARKALHMPEKDIEGVRLVRKSVDARDKGDVHFRLTLDVDVRREP
ncbi:MAG: hypothetical protein IJ074_11195, partial [Clostridia bacterium]|nr:hypothetical protein [Clostridia bacterium]